MDQQVLTLKSCQPNCEKFTNKSAKLVAAAREKFFAILAQDDRSLYYEEDIEKVSTLEVSPNSRSAS